MIFISILFSSPIMFSFPVVRQRIVSSFKNISICVFSKYLLSVYCVPGPRLGPEDRFSSSGTVDQGQRTFSWFLIHVDNWRQLHWVFTQHLVLFKIYIFSNLITKYNLKFVDCFSSFVNYLIIFWPVYLTGFLSTCMNPSCSYRYTHTKMVK